MINLDAWTGVREAVRMGCCDECGVMGPLPLPEDADCAHVVIRELAGSRVERLAAALRFTYGSANGERRPMHEGRNDWIADAEELLKVVRVV